jgi:hypothetical protein
MSSVPLSRSQSRSRWSKPPVATIRGASARMPSGGKHSGGAWVASKVSGRPTRCRSAHAFLWEHSY